MPLSSYALSPHAPHFSDGTGLVDRFEPLPEQRSAAFTLLKTCNQFPGSSGGYGSSPAIPAAIAGRLALQPVDRRPVGCEGYRRLCRQWLAVTGAERRLLHVAVVRQ